MNQIEQDIKSLTSNIVDASNKVHLRNTLAVTLVRDLEHPWNEVEPALDAFFGSETVH